MSKLPVKPYHTKPHPAMFNMTNMELISELHDSRYDLRILESSNLQKTKDYHELMGRFMQLLEKFKLPLYHMEKKEWEKMLKS